MNFLYVHLKKIVGHFAKRSPITLNIHNTLSDGVMKETKRNFASVKTTTFKESGLPCPCAGEPANTGLVLGVYTDPHDPNERLMQLTPAADKYNRYLDGRLMEQLLLSGFAPYQNEVRVFYGLDPRFPKVAMVGLGEECLSYNEKEQIDENKERIRQAAASGCVVLQNVNRVENIFVESFGHAESSAEGAAMSLWQYQEHKKIDKRIIIPKLFLFEDCDFTGWHIGLHKAAAQNLARQLSDAPPNLLTPRSFAEHTVKLLNASGINIEVKIKKWLKIVGMDSLLAVGRGSCEDPVLVEATYYGCDPGVCPVVLIGKAVTFDSGGLCLKTPDEMEYMRNDMAGAACVIAALRAASALQLPINIRALIPMCENMIGPKAMKPGDTIKSLKGQTVNSWDTNLDSRLSVIDVLSYAATYNPKLVLDIGSFNRNMIESLGFAATGVWTNNDKLWEQVRVASIHTGDRVWRFPLWKHFSKRIVVTGTSDTKDVLTELGGPSLAAAFLNRFLCGGDWIHMDIYGVTKTNGTTFPYLRKGMTGRPTRTLIEFLAQFACLSPEKLDTKAKGSKVKQPTQKQQTACKMIKTETCK
ncbi:cytosol aminopeptidase-like [Lycorma delicatula]|uniref:cytosol aminopeptidase-like n=1 Tax=Lycorma delicatula TaxID=130591 RepID=UPI003F51A6D4